MKRTFFFFFILIASLPSSAQWKNANFNGQVLAFGACDTNFFWSDVLGSGFHLVYRFAPTSPNGWFGVDNGMDTTGGNITTFASIGPYLFAGSGPTSIGNGYLTTNNGSTWTDPIGGPVGTNGTYIFAQYATRIARSTDSGKSWEHLSYPAGNNYAGNGACVFAYTPNNGIWHSSDSGETWAQIPTPFTGTITGMGSIFFIVGGNGKLVESDDSGIQWVAVTVDSAGIPETVNCLATDGKNLFVGTPTGFLVSTDTGKEWTAKNDSITYQDIYHDNIKATEDVVAIGVFDTLVFADVLYNRSPNGVSAYYLFDRSISELTKPDSTASVVQTEPPNDTIEVYPNPATGTVTILAGGTSILGITVLNVLGENVLDVPNQYASDLMLDLSNLPSGTYFLRIQTANGRVLRKTVINH